MTTQWYYVQGSERVGPVEQEDIESLFKEGTLNPDSYVWRKGFDNWKHLNSVDEFEGLLLNRGPSEESIEDEDDFEEESEDNGVEVIPQMSSEPSFEIEEKEQDHFDLQSIPSSEKVFSIKVGYDRGANEAEYGPFSIDQLKKAYEERRINERTFIFTPGMETWVLLGDFELFNKIAGELPPEVSEADRRINVRKPFVARLFFHDNKKVYEGICRDISVGGLQILVSDFPCEVGDRVNMNVHPDNSDYHFTASGKVVRKLEGNTGFSLRFMDLDGNAHEAIKSYIEEN